MTTEFDWLGSPCECCGHAESFTIGRSAIGWQFTFEAYPDITSYRDLLAFFEANDGQIVDEYGETYTVAEFRRWVERQQRPDLKSHVDDYPQGNFKDSEGYNFAGSWRIQESEMPGEGE